MLQTLANRSSSIGQISSTDMNQSKMSSIKLLHLASVITKSNLTSQIVKFSCQFCLNIIFLIFWLQDLYRKHLIFHKNLLSYHSKKIDSIKISNIIDWCQTLALESLTIYHYNNGHERSALLIGEEFFPSHLKVQIIKAECSHQSIIVSARHLSNSKVAVNLNRIDDCLTEVYSFSDPEFLICFCDSKSLQAFPPWQIRLTEIVFLPSHRVIDEKIFLSQLERYAKCIQRIGC
ncbi:Dehydrodolichyl diphosphate synthase complex subunit nus1 [Sarcoptes scabiei]|nr:Dehydrodolichyl diphosphate synthase complex subunit nus1 [Sarcoptes scabiei]